MQRPKNSKGAGGPQVETSQDGRGCRYFWLCLFPLEAFARKGTEACIHFFWALATLRAESMPPPWLQNAFSESAGVK